MKKIILLAALLLSGIAQAQQISVSRPGGIQITDGQTITTNSIATGDDAPNKIRFKVTNLTEETIQIGIKVLEISDNVDGTQLQLCFDACLDNIYEGLVIPNAFLLDPGATTPSNDDHMWNYNPGTGGDVSYHLAFVKLEYNEETDAYTELEELLDFYYVYQPTAGVTSFSGLQQMGLSIESTVVKNSLNITATQSAALQLFDATGKLVKTATVKSGSQGVDVSALATGVYMAKFTVGNKAATVKVVKN